jgi:hypothetical protein
MDKREVAAKIAELTRQAHALIDEAERLADESGVDFTFSVAWGMGGHYYPPKREGVPLGEEDEDDREYSRYLESQLEDMQQRWLPSSANC